MPTAVLIFKDIDGGQLVHCAHAPENICNLLSNKFETNQTEIDQLMDDNGFHNKRGPIYPPKDDGSVPTYAIVYKT